MQKNFTDEVVVLLLPLFFNKVKFENEKYNFLNFNEIVKNDPSFESFSSFELTKESITYLLDQINDYKPTDHFLGKLEKILTESEKKTIIVNFPSNIEQFKILNSKLSQRGATVSKVIVSNFENFENFEKLVSNMFTCPFCFNSFEKSLCLVEEKYLVCPFDGNKVSLSFSQKFIKSFNERYFKNSLDFAQSLSSLEKTDSFSKPVIFPLMIPEVSQIEEFLIDKMSDIV